MRVGAFARPCSWTLKLIRRGWQWPWGVAGGCYGLPQHAPVRLQNTEYRSCLPGRHAMAFGWSFDFVLAVSVCSCCEHQLY